ncbi:hypothetical protein DL240_15780 [Lujinxingia litoralis]|uniref:Uncharacterized protein n=1 Tax=Lujinxingia litoralis TaxID=2211119 RepID=A0A328C701_9DELT|nr:hypothetical protein [Lujinxingia litoralis]RAL20774.1 hypothetical protein DL240_15780 [Lujinxingia litoralis]
MEVLFCFVDAPAPGDRWATDVSLDGFIEAHGEFCDIRGWVAAKSSQEEAQNWTREAVAAGLQHYARETFARRYLDLLERVDALVCEALQDSVLVMQVLLDRPGASGELRAREREIWAEVLDSEEGVARYVSGTMMEMRGLSRLERMRRLYALRGERLGRSLPFGVNAVEILSEAFGSEAFVVDFLAIKERAVRPTDAVSRVCRDLAQRDLRALYRNIFRDSMRGLCERFSVSRRFQRYVVQGWVLPEVDRRFQLRELGQEPPRETQVRYRGFPRVQGLSGTQPF